MNTTETQKQGSEQSHANAEQTHKQKSNSKYEFEPVENTPFTLYGSKEEGYIVLMGSYRLTEKMTKKEALEDAQKMEWNRILQVIMAVLDTAKNEEQTTNTKN